jgi:hypothetical protein
MVGIKPTVRHGKLRSFVCDVPWPPLGAFFDIDLRRLRYVVAAKESNLRRLSLRLGTWRTRSFVPARLQCSAAGYAVGLPLFYALAVLAWQGKPVPEACNPMRSVASASAARAASF